MLLVESLSLSKVRGESGVAVELPESSHMSAFGSVHLDTAVGNSMSLTPGRVAVSAKITPRCPTEAGVQARWYPPVHQS